MFLGYNYQIMLKILRTIAVRMLPWIIGGAVVVGAIVSVARQQHRAAEEYEAAREKRCASSFPLDPEKQGTCKHERDGPGNYLPWGYILVAWPEGIIAWAIIVTGVFIAWQGYETRKAVKAANAQIAMMKETERARLVIRFVNDPEIGKPEDILEGSIPLRVFFFVENIGKSKAFNARASGVVDIVSDPEKGSHEDGFFQAFPQIIDEGSEKHRLSLAGFGIEFEDDFSTGDFQAIPREIAAQIREGKKAFIQASGLLIYEDIFGDPHQTPFRLAWKSRGDDAGGMWLTRSVWVDYSPDST